VVAARVRGGLIEDGCSQTKLEGPRVDSGMREAERCTDVTNAVVGEADGAPCWRSSRHRLWGGRRKWSG
jgi:hypothetical protein